MRFRPTRIATLLTPLLLTLTLPTLARGEDEAVRVSVTDGAIAETGDRGTLDLEIVNQTGVDLRLVALRAEYDTVAGDTLVFESGEDLEARIAAGETIVETIAFTTQFAEGARLTWSAPYTLDVALGADLAALVERVEGLSERVDAVTGLLREVNHLLVRLGRSNRRFPERLAALDDAEAWFDTDALEALREPLEASLCEAMGRDIRRAGAARARVTAYRRAVQRLLDFDLYPDCLPRQVRLTVGRDLVATDRASDALVLTERDDDGEVLDEWLPIYVAGRLGLAELALRGEQYRQLRPGIESLGEVAELDPENRRLAELTDQLLARSARHVERLIEEERELEAFPLVELMKRQFPEHEQVTRAATAMLEALYPYVQRALTAGNAVRANNAYVRGLATLADLPDWEAEAARIQAARRDHLLEAAREALRAEQLGEAAEALRRAGELAPIDPEVQGELSGSLLRARWAALDERLAEGHYEDVMAQAQQLESEAHDPTALGEARAALYLSLAEAVWERYGFLAGLATRTRLGLAEEALALGEAADPQRAQVLARNFFLARWLFPTVLGVVLLIALAALLLRGRWRRRRKARRLWKHGRARAERGDLGGAAKRLHQAFELVEFETDPAAIVGEESRGHLVLRIAAVQSQRGRRDRVEAMRSEWGLLDDWERPFAQDFDEALEQVRS